MMLPQKIRKPIVITVLITCTIMLYACNETGTEKSAQTSLPINNATPAESVQVAPSETNSTIAQLQREADNGDPDAQYNLAYMYENGLGVAKDEVKALEYYEKAAYLGHAAAKNNLEALKKH